jgi:protein-L-isoaspartate(D-aspartate) O-methyltransferase
MVAHMTEQLALQPEHRVLEVGTGSGYQTAILSLLCRSVYTVETVAPLAEAARARLQRLDVANCHFHTGDGTLGWPQQAPFDRIIVTAGASRIPQPLVEQLVIGGVMILPLGGQREQRLTRIERRAGRTIEWPGLGCRFVKLIGRHSWPQDQDEHNTN